MGFEHVSPGFLAAYAECCERIVSGPERPYDVARELMWVIADPDELPKLPGAVYIMWGEMTDVCALRDELACRHAEDLMREAASEFLALEDA
ncbi:MAG TPA: hypothetical protein VGM80_15660, partial [Gaiellaceae bacterium]